MKSKKQTISCHKLIIASQKEHISLLMDELSAQQLLVDQKQDRIKALENHVECLRELVEDLIIEQGAE